ncbi:MAG: molybdate ABC transporter permease subunit [Spirochaetaceae bacterium]|jgi:molybdate transport system permease protein|nr:molybdate ABC transporter permease subunit [Spirochaetaceae bacterium]
MTGIDSSPILISIRTASAAICVTFFLGLFAAKAVSDIKNRYVKIVVDALLTLPLVLPPTVAGFFLLYIFGARGPVGMFFINVFAYKIAFSWSATVLAAAAISFPLMYRSSLGALEQVDRNLLFAGRTLGMSEAKIFFAVTMPTALPGIASGAILAFARGLGEFGATAMIAGNIAGKTRTMPLAIYSAVAGGDMDAGYQYVLIMVIFSFCVVALMHYFTARGKK